MTDHCHYFLDVEAYGPPGTGDLFAIGIVRFDLIGPLRTGQQHLVSHDSFTASAETMSWLMEQTPEVRAQTEGGKPFAQAWQEILAFFFDQQQQASWGATATFWADDWSDFAWLDIACRRHGLMPLRDLGSQLDSSAITRLAGKPEPNPEHLALFPNLRPHIALDDATQGALELLAALRVLQRPLP